jgi:hypothetical protein
MNPQKKWLFIGIFAVTLIMFVGLAQSASADTLFYNTTGNAVGTAQNVPANNANPGSRAVMNFSMSGTQLTGVGINITNYSGSLVPAGTSIKLQVLYNTSTAYYNATTIYQTVLQPLPLLVTDNSAAPTGTYVFYNISSLNWTLNNSQTYSLMFVVINGSNNLGFRQTTGEHVTGSSSMIAGAAAVGNEMPVALYSTTASTGVPFTTTVYDIFDTTQKTNITLSVNGSDYNQTFYSTNASVVVYPLADMSGNNNSFYGTSVQNTTGAVGQAQSFVQTTINEYIYAPNTTMLSANHSFMGWVYLTNTTTARTIFSKSPDYTNFFVVDVSGANFRISNIKSGTTINCNQATATVSANYWHHVGYVINSTHTTLYINGSQVQQCAYANNGIGLNTANLTISRRWDSTTTNKWVGSLDELQWFNNTQLNASDFVAGYQKRPISVTPFIYLPFENITSASTSLYNLTVDSTDMRGYWAKPYADYNVSTNLIASIYPSYLPLNVTAKDYYDNQSLSDIGATFTPALELSQNNYTSTGVLTVWLPLNTTETIYLNSNQSGGYYQKGPYTVTVNSSYNNYLNDTLYQSIVGFTATEKYTGTAITGVQANVTNQSNTSSLYLKAGSYTATLGKSGYFNEEITFTANATQSQSLISTDWHNARLNITAFEYLTGNQILIFNTSIIATDYGNVYEQGSTTNGSYIFDLLNGTYNVTIDSANYSISSTLLVVNGSVQVNNQSFLLVTTNSINITFKDEETDAVLVGTPVYMQFIGSAATYNQLNATGYAFIDLISPDNYTIRYNASGYNERFSYFEMTNRSNLNMTLYLLNSSSATNITATVYDQTGSTLEGAFIYVFRYDFATNDYLLVEVAQTNFLGQASFSAALNSEYYKFIIQFPVGQTRLTTTPTYLTSSTITFVINTGETVGSVFDVVQGISGYLTFNTATNNARFEYVDSSLSVSNVCLYAYNVYGNVSTVLYNSTCSTSTSDVILTWVDNSTNSLYLIKSIVTVDGEEYLFDELYVDFRSSDNYGVLGLFAAVIVTLTWIFISKGNPVTLLVGAGIPLILTTILGWTGLPMWIPVGIEILLIIAAMMISKRA